MSLDLFWSIFGGLGKWHMKSNQMICQYMPLNFFLPFFFQVREVAYTVKSNGLPLNIFGPIFGGGQVIGVIFFSTNFFFRLGKWHIQSNQMVCQYMPLNFFGQFFSGQGGGIYQIVCQYMSLDLFQSIYWGLGKWYIQSNQMVCQYIPLNFFW